MRTKRIKLYSYEELSTESKIKVINQAYKISPNLTHDEIYLISASFEYLKDGTKFTEL